MSNTYVPVTPLGTSLFYLKAYTEEDAWHNLEKSGCKSTHIPTKENFINRGYTVRQLMEHEEHYVKKT